MWPFKSSSSSPSVVRQLTAVEAREKIANGNGDIQLVDVREPFEYQLCRIDGAIHVPLRKILVGNDPGLSPEKEVICYCHHGARSQQAAQVLARRGFRQVYNLQGGIHAWSMHVDPSVPVY